METIKGFFYKPDPATQLRKCNTLIRANSRQLDRHVAHLTALELKTKNSILAVSRRKNASPTEIRILARELVRIRRQKSRMATSKAQLESVGMQVREAFGVRKIEGSIRASTGVMKDVNSLVRLPELTSTMRDLGAELVKAGIIEEMVGDMVPGGEEDLMEDEEDETEVDKVIGEITGVKKKEPTKAVHMPEVPAAFERDELAEEQAKMKEFEARLALLKGDVDEDEEEERLQAMQARLEELKS